MSRRTPGLLLCLGLIVVLSAPAAAQYSNPDAGGGEGAAAPPADDSEQAGPKKKSKWGKKSADSPDGEEWGQEYAMSPRTAKKILAAREALLSEDYDKTEVALRKIKMHRANPLERARVYQIWAFVYYGRGDLDSARENLELAIAEKAIPRDESADMRFQIAQIYLQENDWKQAAEQFELWFTVVRNPNAAAYHTLALTYYQLDNLDKSLENSIKAVELTDEPREGWLQLLLALRLTRKEYKASVPLLEELVRRYPKKIYWLQLSTVHGALEHYQESLVQLQLAYAQGILTEDAELRRLAELLLFLELPYRAAGVMELGLVEDRVKRDTEAYELLSNSRIAAREFGAAVAPLEQAAELAEDGELYIRLAQVHLQGEDWEAAADSIRRAMNKGGLKSEGDAKLLMGIAYYSQKKPQQALTWFGRASRHEESAQEANVWLRYIERELQSG
jgi:Tfp pilus assembly protein PilF